MKKIILLSALVIVSAMAYVHAATDTGIASAEIIAPLAVDSVTDINFGKWVLQAGAVGVVLSPAGAITTSPTTHLGGHAAGVFNIEGQPNTSVDVSIANATLTSGGGDTMAMGSYTFSTGATHNLNASGESTVNFGATLSASANQPVGVYTGTYTITVNY